MNLPGQDAPASPARGKRGPYPIKTTYWQGKSLVKTTHARSSNSAVSRCVQHMQLDEYGASAAEVFDSRSGVLHAVLTRSPMGMRIVFKRKPEKGL